MRVRNYYRFIKYVTRMLGDENMIIKIARIKAGLTQAQLCKEIKMSPKKLIEVERGNYDILTLGNMKALSKALGMSIQELLDLGEQ